MNLGGVFPFGQPSTERPPRRPAGPADAFVLGVYPSALHVRWQPPAYWAGRQARTVSAMAVDVEPVVFWDGANPDPSTLIAAWKDAVGFVDGDDVGCDGHVGDVATNGSSGLLVSALTLEPLGIDPASVWMTDAVPWLFVKYGTKTKREQGDVLAEVYNPFALVQGRQLATLPRRPTSVVAHAAEHERSRLRSELLESGAPVVLTFGEEARQVLERIVDAAAGPPTRKLDAEDYGSVGSITVEGRNIAWHALVHPGQRALRWTRAHGLWTGTWAD